MRHGGDAADEVAQVVRKVRVVALVESLPRKIAVVAEHDFLDEIQTERIDAVTRGGVERIDDRGRVRFAHPLIVDGHEAVCEDRLRQRQAGAHQHRRPDHRMESRNVLADQVQVCRPPGLEPLRIGTETDTCRVIDQRVEPDVDDALGIPGQRNAPRLTGPADRDVVEAALEQPQLLVATRLGHGKFRMLSESARGAAAGTSTGGKNSSSL